MGEEDYVSEWSAIEIDEDRHIQINTDILPLYTATHIQLVHMTDEEYIEQSYSDSEEKVAIEVFIPEGFYDEEGRDVSDQITSSIREIDRSIGYITLSSNKASERKEKILNIDEYPVFLVYDKNGLVNKSYDLQSLVDFFELRGK